MQGDDVEEDEGIEIRPHLLEQELQREAQERREQQKWSYKWHHLPFKEKIYVFGIIISIVISIFSISFNAFILPTLQPHPTTIIEDENFYIQMGSGNSWEVLKLRIENKGNDESSKITVEITLHDNMSFYYADSLNNKYSRPPKDIYQEDKLLILSWDYLLPHTSIDISQRINFLGFESSVPIYPKHIVISAKDEDSPIFEYP